MVSAPMKRGMETATRAPPTMMEAANTLPDFPVAVVSAAAAADAANQHWSG
jgi:hypothetical protein